MKKIERECVSSVPWRSRCHCQGLWALQMTCRQTRQKWRPKEDKKLWKRRLSIGFQPDRLVPSSCKSVWTSRPNNSGQLLFCELIQNETGLWTTRSLSVEVYHRLANITVDYSWEVWQKGMILVPFIPLNFPSAYGHRFSTRCVLL